MTKKQTFYKKPLDSIKVLDPSVFVPSRRILQQHVKNLYAVSVTRCLYLYFLDCLTSVIFQIRLSTVLHNFSTLSIQVELVWINVAIMYVLLYKFYFKPQTTLQNCHFHLRRNLFLGLLSLCLTKNLAKNLSVLISNISILYSWLYQSIYV